MSKDFLKMYFDLESLKKESPEFVEALETLIDDLGAFIEDDNDFQITRNLLAHLDWDEFHDLYLDVMSSTNDDVYKAEVIAEYERRISGE